MKNVGYYHVDIDKNVFAAVEAKLMAFPVVRVYRYGKMVKDAEMVGCDEQNLGDLKELIYKGDLL